MKRKHGYLSFSFIMACLCNKETTNSKLEFMSYEEKTARESTSMFAYL